MGKERKVRKATGIIADGWSQDDTGMHKYDE